MWRSCRCTNASAAEIVRVVNSLYQGGAAPPRASGVKVVADERSNSVLIGGEQSQRLRMRALIAHLDTPLEAGGDTRVRYLHYADAEKIAPKLKEQMTGIAQVAGAAAGAGGAAGRRRRLGRRGRRAQRHGLGGPDQQRAGHHRAAEADARGE